MQTLVESFAFIRIRFFFAYNFVRQYVIKELVHALSGTSIRL